MSTTMIDIREFAQFVSPDVPKAPIAIVTSALVGALREFCLKTNLWIRTSDWTDILGGQQRYGFAAPTDAEVCGILSMSYRADVTLAPQPVRPVSYDELTARRPGWRSETGKSPSFYWAEQPAIVWLVPYPAVADGDQLQALQVDVSLQPSFTATTAPDFLLHTWGEYIGAGAKKRLLTMPKQPWTGDPTPFIRQFQDGISRCKTAVNKSSTRTSMRVQFQRQGV